MYKSDYFNGLSPINQAHLLERKANNYLRKEKYEDAIALHVDAANLLQSILNEAKSMDLNSSVLGSLNAQIQYHRKQDKLILLRKEQKDRLREKLQRKSLKASHEPFQDLADYSTTSIDSYGSSDLLSASGSASNTNLLQDHLNKRDEVIQHLGLLVRQQQAQILVLSGKLKEKTDENKRLYNQIETLEHQLQQTIGLNPHPDDDV